MGHVCVIRDQELKSTKRQKQKVDESKTIPSRNYTKIPSNHSQHGCHNTKKKKKKKSADVRKGVGT